MPVNRCKGCGSYFGGDFEASYCSQDCKQKVHERLRPRRSAPKPSTSLVFRAFEALAAESAKFNDYHGRMRRPRRPGD